MAEYDPLVAHPCKRCGKSIMGKFPLCFFCGSAEMEHGCTSCRACEISHCRICAPCGMAEPPPHGVSSRELGFIPEGPVEYMSDVPETYGGTELRRLLNKIACFITGHPCEPTGRHGYVLLELRCKRCDGLYVRNVHQGHGLLPADEGSNGYLSRFVKKQRGCINEYPANERRS